MAGGYASKGTKQLLGYGIGELVSFNPASPNNFTLAGLEYLKTGYIKAFLPQYSALASASPASRVFKLAAANKTTVANYSANMFFTFIGGNYIASVSGHQYFCPTLGGAWSAADTQALLSSNTRDQMVNNGTYIVGMRNALAPMYSTTGAAAYTAVGGASWASTNSALLLAYGNNIWCAMADMANSAFLNAYISAANPSGAWSFATSPNFGSTSNLTGLKFIDNGGANLFCALARGAATGIYATCADGHTWTDRTAALIAAGILPGVDIGPGSCMSYSGQAIVASFAGGGVARSTDGVNFAPVPSATIFASTPTSLVSDGLGNIVAGYNTSGLFAYSTDHGQNFNPLFLYPWASLDNNIQYANGKWIIGDYDWSSTPFSGNPTHVGQIIADTLTPTRWLRIV